MKDGVKVEGPTAPAEKDGMETLAGLWQRGEVTRYERRGTRLKSIFHLPGLVWSISPAPLGFVTRVTRFRFKFPIEINANAILLPVPREKKKEKSKTVFNHRVDNFRWP